jgi:hypothetical protein
VDTEAKYLQSLLAACQRVLPYIEGREDELAEAIRQTCLIVDARLRELEAGSASSLPPQRADR